MRNAPPTLVWPHLLELPSSNVPQVYLEMNHWISLAQASTGHQNGIPFLPTLNTCKSAKSAGAARFVRSAIHYMEMQKIKDPSQRRAVGEIMEELAGFAPLLDRVVVMELELDAMLDKTAHTPSPLPKIPLLGRSVRHCFGRPSGMRIKNASGEDVTEGARLRIGPERFDSWVDQTELLLSRSVLQGPTDEEVEELQREPHSRFLATAKHNLPTHNPAHNSWCLVRLARCLAVPAVL